MWMADTKRLAVSIHSYTDTHSIVLMLAQKPICNSVPYVEQTALTLSFLHEQSHLLGRELPLVRNGLAGQAAEVALVITHASTTQCTLDELAQQEELRGKKGQGRGKDRWNQKRPVQT